MIRLGVVTGLIIEAARIEAACGSLPGPETPLVGAAGGSAERAEQIARQHVSNGARVLVSFGVAGGLDPSLSPGDIVAGTSVWHEADRVRMDTASSWTELFAAALGSKCRVMAGGVAGIDAPVNSAVEKDTLRQKSGALAADMESHGVAKVATEAGIPLLVIRAVADPAIRAIPAAALVGMGPDGQRRPLAVLGTLMTRPQDLAGVIRLARDSSAAMRSLTLAANALMLVSAGEGSN